MIKYFFILSFFLSFNLNASNIATIKINYVIENSNDYKIFITNFESSRENISKKFKVIENKLLEDKKLIESSTLVFSQDEITKKLNEYEQLVNTFETDVYNFNLFFKKTIDVNKKIILDELIKIITTHAVDNNIDVILNENNYFISSDNIDISDLMLSQLNNIKFNLSFEEYKFVYN